MIETDNGAATAMTTPGGLEDRPLPKVSRRELLPSTWVNRTLRLSYVDASGAGVETSGTLLELCVTGPVFNLAGGKALVSWDAIRVLELVED
jgi:hypothetical protein